MKTLLVILFFFFSGCASSEYAEETSQVLNYVAQGMRRNSEILEKEFPQYEGLCKSSGAIAEEAARHASQPATPPIFNAVMGAAKSALGPYGELIAFGVTVLVGAGGVAIQKKKQANKNKDMNELINDLVNQPDPEKCQLRLKGVKLA